MYCSEILPSRIGGETYDNCCNADRFYFSKEASIAPLDYNRWLAIPPANLVHVAIGAVYAYSMWTPSLSTVLGVVGPAKLDWSQSDLIPTFSVAATTFGVTCHMLGGWVDRVGPRLSGLAGSVCWGTGLILTGMGAELHSLPLLYGGYGILGGAGWGLMYLLA
mmetsp:Transcript_16846/g.23980  ORF Transcript_16846/g.23980 Transcript_16846/m.23980 type:complete len:163 (-) Transcript_16846:262-750(-)